MLYLNDKRVIDNGGAHAQSLKTCQVDLIAGKPYPIRLEFAEYDGEASMKLVWEEPGSDGGNQRIEEAAVIARDADVAIVCVGNTDQRESEGQDLSGFEMDSRQDDLVKAVAGANRRTIVVLFGGTPIDMSAWINDVEGVIVALYPGQEGGEALAEILVGEVGPSAKLPFSYIRKKSDTYAFDGYRMPAKRCPTRKAFLWAIGTMISRPISVRCLNLVTA